MKKFFFKMLILVLPFFLIFLTAILMDPFKIWGHHEEFYKPSTNGVLIYFTAFSGDLNNELEKIEKSGGIVLHPKTLISEEIGHMAIFLDSEGNRIALHSRW